MEKEVAERGVRVVVLLPCPLQGHLSPMLELGTALRSKGFSITIAHTQFNSPNPSSHPDFLFLPIPDALTGADFAGSNLALISALNANCEVPLKERLVQAEEQMGGRAACVVYDTLMYVGETVANRLKIPSIVFRTSGASAMVAYGAMPRLLAAGYFPVQDSKLQDPVPQLQHLRFKDVSRPKSENSEALLQLLEIICNIRTSSAVIWNTADFLELPALAELRRQHRVPFFSIGPLFKIASISTAASTSLLEEDSRCISWLAKQAPKSVLYVSLGSLAILNEEELTEMAWGLANSGQPFLWVVRPGSVRGSQWTELLPEGFEEEVRERGLAVKWAPQKEVVAHGGVGGFWSHCGWNSILESVSEGVPMICSPRFEDQKVNARYVSHVWNVGVELEEDEMERGQIEKAIRRVMEGEEGREMRRRTMELKEKFELCVNNGGSSYNSLNDLADFILSL